jgi:cephalosporin-C deacetylase-like acetyl esterase
MRISIVLMFLVPLVCRAQDDLSVLQSSKGETPPRRMLHAYLIAECQKHFDARKEAIANLKTPDDLTKRQRALRAKFIDALGGFPEKTDLKPQVIGKLDRDGYIVEKIIFESRPNHHVTANLYLPAGKGPFPVVLMPIGHSASGKVASQNIAVMLAKQGIASFPYDPIGQGERRQLLDEKGKAFISSMTNEHTLIGVGALLNGESTASYRIWDGIRALDYLCSRPEIDWKHIGCTGVSGGGTLTSYLMALDERILAAAPSCYITSLDRLFATIGPQDAEQNISGQVAFGMDHADYILLRAPKPTLLLAGTKDFFNIDGTWASFREAKRIYTMLGVPEKIDLVETDTTHGYPKGQREPMVRFMKRWLLGKDEPYAEETPKLDPEADLRCTRTGQALEDLKGKSCFDLNRERTAELATLRAKANLTSNELRSKISGLIGMQLPAPAATMRHAGTIKRDTYRIEKLIFETEPRIQIPALLFVPGDKVDLPIVIYLNGQGKSADAEKDGAIEKLALAGNRVLAIDPRGFGEVAPAGPPKSPSYFGVDFTNSFLALHLNRPLLGQRVYDVLSVIRYMANESGQEVSIVGIGSAGLIALHAAALSPIVKQTTIDKGLISWTNVVNTPVSYNQLTHVVPGALKVYDLPDLAALIAPRALTIRGAFDAADKPANRKALEHEYANAIKAYSKNKRDDQLKLQD